MTLGALHHAVFAVAAAVQDAGGGAGLDAKTIVGIVGGLVAAAATLATTVIAVIRFFSRREKQIATRAAFRNVVESLSSADQVQRLGGAILLRRFLDPHTELGDGRTPYAREVIDVIAAILRDVETGNFQKLLADGLRYAPSLEHADLQRTNLQRAYLGQKGEEKPNLIGADFFRADLSAASLKGARASHAVFYQARLHNTILKGATLHGANFFEADLLGANLSGAMLEGADFRNARHLPPGLAEHLDSSGVYHGPEKFQPRATAPTPALSVFLSKPGTLNVHQRELVGELVNLLEGEDVAVVTVEREDYPDYGAINEVRRVLAGCAGAVILGFRQLDVRDGTWRAGTEEAADVKDMALPTTWNHVEAGMAAMVGLPILMVIEEGVVGGLFELEDVDHVVTNVDVGKPDYGALRGSVAAWSRSVRERAS